MKKSPVTVVRERFQSKEKLVEAVQKLASADLWVDRVSGGKGLAMVSNQQLLKLHDVHAMAHITGGGLTEHLLRVIPDGLGLDIDASAWTLPPVVDWLQREGAVENAEMWRTFNCGIGFVLVVAPDQLVAVQADLVRLQLAHWQIGEVVTAHGGERVRIG